MGALKKLFTWFRDSQSPTLVRVARVRARAVKADDDLHRAAHEAVTAAAIPAAAVQSGEHYWYVFFYRSGQVPKTAKDQSRPKESFGPFATRADAVAARDKELALYEQPKRQYRIRRLTPDRYLEIWNYES